MPALGAASEPGAGLGAGPEAEPAALVASTSTSTSTAAGGAPIPPLVPRAPRQAPPPATQPVLPPLAPSEAALPPAAVAPPDTFSEELPYGVPGEPVTVGERASGELALAEEDTELGAEGPGLEVAVQRTLVPGRVLTPVAGGLILVLCAAHVWRFRSS